ncbi:MFS transporter [Pseudidiomarina sp. 1APR75-33.1]|uniref:MFS transporter n=1 Tax=Pseudidiomarina terrestris TaxID=2820060 RepID=UPI002656A1DC|nr:MFS transporter [Pseudidiomarina sp. 1APR75-33.1]MDN7126490.1 MFS transporter [Pseudidiomarina sp. 1APR75-33.1]
MFKQYFRLLQSHPRFLLFGFLATFFSSFGQTFLLGLFTDAFRSANNLSHGEYGAIYAGATFFGGLLLMRIGKQLDTVSLAQFTTFTFIGIALSALLITWPIHLLTLFLGLAGLRLFGQGFMGHIAMTSMGRYFTEQRGKAVAFAGMGFPLGELVLPLLIVSLLAVTGWQQTWWLFALLLICGLPLMLWLQAHKPKEIAAPVVDHSEEALQIGLRQRDLLRQRRFWVVLPALLGLPFVVTALLLNQLWLAGQQSWSVAATAGAIMLFSLSRVTVSVFAGDWIDRLGSRRFIGLNIVPVILGTLLLAANFGVWSWWAFLGLAGVSAGINSALSGTLWAELYGTRYLATVRALVHAMMVFATALAPFLMGTLIDNGWSPTAIMLMFSSILIVAWLNARRLVD